MAMTTGTPPIRSSWRYNMAVGGASLGHTIMHKQTNIPPHTHTNTAVACMELNTFTLIVHGTGDLFRSVWGTALSLSEAAVGDGPQLGEMTVVGQLLSCCCFPAMPPQLPGLGQAIFARLLNSWLAPDMCPL